MLRRLLAAGVIVLAACGGAEDVTADRSLDGRAATSAPTTTAPTTVVTTSTSTTSTTSTSTSTSTTVAPTTSAPPVAPAAEQTTTTAPIPRVVQDTGFSPYAVVGPADGEPALALLHPAAQVERIGFHEAGHDGTRQQDPTDTAARPMTLETRDRGTRDRTAADIVVPPEAEIRSPVTGTVLRAGGYTLYCDHRDDFAVIEPDARPGWEVKILHIDGVAVRAGDRVEAGVTLIAPKATQLPFESQVDEFTAEPSWPHVHIEVVDPSIPDKPNPSGSSC